MPLNKVLANMKAMLYVMLKGMFAYRKIFSAYIFVLFISGCIYVISLIYPDIANILAVSRSTPWGVVTSIFTHSNLLHFAYNMGSLFIFILMFAFANSTFSVQKKQKLEPFFLVSAFIFAIVSNVLWVVLTPSPSIGASGLVYAVVGILTGYTLFNGLQALYVSKIKAQNALTACVIYSNILLSALLLVQVFQDPQLFLNVGDGVNVFAHGISYLLGLFAVLPYYMIKKVSIMD